MTSSHGAARLLVVADDALTRLGLAALAEQQGNLRVVGSILPDELGIGQRAAETLAIYTPDLLLWEVRSPESERQIELLATVSDDLPPVLVIHGEGVDEQPLWVAGAQGVLPRSASGRQLSAAIGALLEGLSVFSRQGEAPAPRRTARGAKPEKPPEALTPRELEVLQAVADGLANKQIARALGMSEHTVKFHINSILGKLGASSRTDAVVRATRAGLLFL
jgi:DNA-binding NarL/FixJ family response regulator